MQTTPTNRPANGPPDADLNPMRSREFQPRRARWPGLLGLAVIAAAVIVGVVTHYATAPEVAPPAATAPASPATTTPAAQ